MSMTVAVVTITKTLTENDVIVTIEQEPDLPLIDVLGLLEFAKDSLIRQSMGEADEPD